MLAAGVQSELVADRARIVVWVPDRHTNGSKLWHRISTVADAPITCDRGLCAVAAVAVPTRRQSGHLLAKLLRWCRAQQDSATWYLPSGQITEQCGERRADVLLVWLGDGSEQIGETQVRQQWPACQQLRRLAPNLFLVMGVDGAGADQPALPLPPEITACALANRLLAQARQRSDTAELAAALTDMAIVIRKKGDAAKAVTLLEEALTLIRQLGNLAREMDVLGNLGLAQLKLGNAAAALQAFLAQDAAARQLGTKFAEKTANHHLGWPTPAWAIRLPPVPLCNPL